MLLALKKGGVNQLDESYLENYFPCEEYNYDCGYMETSESFIQCANGISLNMTLQEFNSIPVNETLLSKIRPYIREQGQCAFCGIKMFNLELTPSESEEFFKGYMDLLTDTASKLYGEKRINGTLEWRDVNINVKTAVLQTMKEKTFVPKVGEPFWDAFFINDFNLMSEELKMMYI